MMITPILRPTIVAKVVADSSDQVFPAVNHIADLRLWVAAGIALFGTVSGAGVPGMDCSAMKATSQAWIVNAGTMWGKGGNGGNRNDGNGVAGGDSLKLAAGVVAIIDNGSGNIWGGGGGGGAGHPVTACGLTCSTGGAGGGGGGQGKNGGTGGTGGGDVVQCGALAFGQNGTAGTTAGPGNGGTAGNQKYDEVVSSTAVCINSAVGTAGANGGATATAGANASSGTGGAAGKAINLNGGTVNFLSGNNGAQVKGAVS